MCQCDFYKLRGCGGGITIPPCKVVPGLTMSGCYFLTYCGAHGRSVQLMRALGGKALSDEFGMCRGSFSK